MPLTKGCVMNVLILDGGHINEETPTKTGLLVVLGPVRPTGRMLPDENFTRRVLYNLMERIDAVSRVFVPDPVERAAFSSKSQALHYWHVLSDQTATEDQLWSTPPVKHSYYHPESHYPLPSIPPEKCGKLSLLVQGDGEPNIPPYWKMNEARERAQGYSNLRLKQWGQDLTRPPLRLGFGQVSPNAAPLDVLITAQPPRSSKHALRGWVNQGIDTPMSTLHAFPVDNPSMEEPSSHVPFKTWTEIRI